MRTQHVAGMSVGIARHGKTVCERGYGYSDLGRSRPARADTVYRIGSLTKAFTAAAILSLADRGKLSLDEPAAPYLPPFAWSHAITIRDLLAQRSGIASYTDDRRLDRYGAYTPEQLLSAAALQPPEFEPGARFGYSNTNYVALGAIIERVTRMPYAAYLQSAVLEPLGLRHTRYGDQTGQARGYARNALEFPVRPSSTSYAFSAAGMTSDVPDLLRWLNVAREPYYGFLQSGIYGYHAIYAVGNVDGYSAFELLVPQTRDALVVLTNADQLDVIPLAESMFAALEPPEDAAFAQGFGPAQNEDPRVTALVRAVLEQIRSGTIDPALLTPRFAAMLARGQGDRLRRRLAPLGTITQVEFTRRETSGAVVNAYYYVSFSGGSRVGIRVALRDDRTVDGIAIFDDS